MKFLVDRCAGRRLADWLSNGGHDSVYAVPVGSDPGDGALLQKAVSENRILVTIDTDFGRLVYSERWRSALRNCAVARCKMEDGLN